MNYASDQGRGVSDRLIIWAAVLYLLLPNVLFLLGWVQWYWACPLVAALAFSYVLLCKSVTATTSCRLRRGSVRILPLIVLVAAICTESLGLHGHVPQEWDFIVRNPIYATLIRCDWPIYQADGGYFVYYMAYWLPPALIAKICSARISPDTILWIWNFVGILLLFMILWIRWNRRVLMIMLLICCMGSLNDMRRIFSIAKWAWEQWPSLSWIEPYASLFADWTNYFFLGLWNQLSVNTPHTTIPICMVIALVFCKKLPRVHIPFVAALSVLWSPLAAVVLLPWIMLKMSGQLNSWHAWKSVLGQLSLWSGCCMLIPVGVYFSCSNAGTIHFIVSDSPYYNEQMIDQLTRVGKACSIMLMMLVPMLIFLRKRYRKTGITFLCAILIILLPIVWIGYENNELLFKGSAVIFMLLAVLYASRLAHARGLCKWTILAFVLLSSGEFLWDMGFRVIHKYTFDAHKMQEHIRDDWNGHLNHPDHFAYKNFFGRTPSSRLLYGYPGASAQHVLKPFATEKNADGM